MIYQIAVLSLAVATAAAGQSPAVRLTDINATHSGPAATTDRIGDFYFLREMVTIGNRLWFTADDGIHGVELWSTDGSEAGTRRQTDLCPGRCSAHPRALTAFGSRLFFIGDDGVHGSEPWITDGTAAGTRLLADVWPGLGDGGGYGWAVATATHVVFGGTTPGEGTDPWVSDGTPAGTARLRDFHPGPASTPVLGVGSLGPYAFFVGDDGVHGYELWRTDGTQEGTVVLEAIPGPNGGVAIDGNLSKGAASTASALYFPASDGLHGVELWRTDGTVKGTRMVRDVQPGPGFGHANWLAAWNDRAYFRADDGVHGAELWASDGTEAGTVLVADLLPGPEGSSPQVMTPATAGVFFRTLDSAGEPRLAFTDGTTGGTHTVPTLTPLGLPAPVATGAGVTFHADDGVHGTEPWFSDGSVAGTIPLADLVPGPASSFGTWDFVRGWRRDSLNGRGYFWAFSPVADFELWSSDGTPAGTRRVKDVNAMASSLRPERLHYYFEGPDYQPIGPAATPTGLAFLATDGPLDPAHPTAGTTGLELWHVEHESGKVFSLGDLEPGPASSLPSAMVPYSGGVLFADAGGQRWRTSGAPDSAEPYGGSSGSGVLLARLTDSIIVASGGVSALSLDLSVETPLAASGGEVVASDGSRAYFHSFGDGGFGVTDGTPEGTRGLSAPGQFGSSLTGVGLGEVALVSSDEETGFEPWIADGTPDGTRRLLDVRPGPASSFLQIRPLNVEWEGYFPILRTAGVAAFFSADDGLHGAELWATDGTSPGTRLVVDLFPGARGSDVRRLTAIGSGVFFVADDGVHGRELWLSDGTALGTRLVRDLAPGPGSAVPQELTAIGDLLVFNAWTPEAGRESWISDGSASGTLRLTDLAPGPASSSPVTLVSAGGWLYFTANDNVTGDELWRLPLSVLQTGSIFADGFESGTLAAWSTP